MIPSPSRRDALRCNSPFVRAFLPTYLSVHTVADARVGPKSHRRHQPPILKVLGRGDGNPLMLHIPNMTPAPMDRMDVRGES